MALESTITRNIMKMAKAEGWDVRKYHGNSFTVAGTPDLFCLRDSHCVWLEVKQPGKHPTKLQIHEMKRLSTGPARTPCFVVHSVEEAKEALHNGWQVVKDKS